MNKKLSKIIFMADGKTPRCPNCGEAMDNAIDKITGKVSEYLWECECSPNVILSVG